MLTHVSITAPRFGGLNPLVLPIGRDSSGEQSYRVSFIDGLGPADAEISTSKYAITGGEHFEGSRANMRNIVLTLELVPSYSDGESPETLRARLYKYFTPKHKVELTFESSNFGERSIEGYVESFEAPLFVETPAAQISIVCPDPYFKTSEVLEVSGNSSGGTPIVVTNNGDVTTDLSATIMTKNTMTWFEFRTTAMGSSTSRSMVISGTVSGTSWVMLNSQVGNKYIWDMPTYRSMLPLSTADSEWPLLEPGENLITVSSNGTLSVFPVFMSFTERYIGL